MRIKLMMLLLFMLLLAGCNSEPIFEPYTLSEKRSNLCQEEIEETVSTLIHAKKLTLSQDVFFDTASLYLTNQKNMLLRKSPIYNDLRGRKTLLMYKKSKKLYIGLLNKKKEIIDSKEVTKCF